jgi:hypothetical protein
MVFRIHSKALTKFKCVTQQFMNNINMIETLFLINKHQQQDLKIRNDFHLLHPREVIPAIISIGRVRRENFLYKYSLLGSRNPKQFYIVLRVIGHFLSFSPIFRTPSAHRRHGRTGYFQRSSEELLGRCH